MPYTTTLTQKQIEALTEILASTRLPRTETKAKAIDRLGRYAVQNDLAAVDLLAATFDDAAEFIRHRLANPAPRMPTKKRRPLRVVAEAPPAAHVEPTPAPTSASSDGLVITADEKRHAKTIGRSHWRIEKAGAVIDVRWDREALVFRCEIEREGRKVVGEGKSYGAAISAAVRALNEQIVRMAA